MTITMAASPKPGRASSELSGKEHAGADPTYGLPQAVHLPDAHESPLSWFAALTTYLGYVTLIIFGHVRDFFGKLTSQGRYFNADSKPPKASALLPLRLRTCACRAGDAARECGV